jgi:Serine hydroxymethyltransferase
MDAYRAKSDSFDPDIAHAIAGEERRQLDGVEMIPSETYTYPEVLAALGSVLTNKLLGRLFRSALLRRAAIYRRGREYRARPRLKARRTKGCVHFQTKIDLMALHGSASRTGAAGCAPEPRSKP